MITDEVRAHEDTNNSAIKITERVTRQRHENFRTHCSPDVPDKMDGYAPCLTTDNDEQSTRPAPTPSPTLATAARTALAVALTCVAIPLSLLHSRMRRQAGSGWNAAVKDGRVKGIKLLTHSTRGRRDSCLKGSMHRASFPGNTEKLQLLQVPDDMLREVRPSQRKPFPREDSIWSRTDRTARSVTYSTVYTPEQNRSAERANGSVLACARTMFEEVLGIRRQVCLRHSDARATHKATCKNTHEKITGRSPDITQFKTFGCTAWGVVPK